MIQPRPAEPESVRGTASYLDILSRIHERLEPRRYLEIGVRHGRSLALARCPALGLDPAPEIRVSLGPDARVISETSDDYFLTHGLTAPEERPDLVFIDGMHRIEYVLRDLNNVERRALPTTLVVIDDIFPNHPRQADRDRSTRVWTGDVWKILPILRDHRPELQCAALDTSPTGLLLVAGLDPDSPGNRANHDKLLGSWQRPLDPPPAILERHRALEPGCELVDAWLDALRDLRATQPTPAIVREALATR